MNVQSQFRLGCLSVHPPSYEVVARGVAERLEPRVMQVLIALAESRGDVVSRDALVERCWSGRAVGDDAIQRCIARLRRVSEAHGGFTIDTITRNGYRLRETVASATVSDTVDPFAFELLQRGRELAVAFGRPGAVRRGIALLEEAVTRVPTLAPAWALLAQSQVQYRAREAPEHELEPLRTAISNSVARCLALDPGNSGALACLAFIEPPVGAFGRQERILERALASADTTAALAPYSAFCASVGRNREALTLAERAWADDAQHEGIENWRATLLWQNGQSEKSREAFVRIVATGRVRGAMLGHAALLAAYDADWNAVDDLLTAAKDDPKSHLALQSALAAVRALRDPTSLNRELMVARVRERLAKTGSLPLGTLVLFSQLGLVDEAYALVGQASFDGLTRRSSRLGRSDVGFHFLFSRPARALREDLRFPGLCTALRLSEYWVMSGRWPDCTAELAPRYDLAAVCETASRQSAEMRQTC